jgi:hypothetical protein
MAFRIAKKRLSDWLHAVKPLEVNVADLDALSLVHHKTVVFAYANNNWCHAGTTAWRVASVSTSELVPSSMEVCWPWAASDNGVIVVTDPSKISTNFVILGADGKRLPLADTSILAFAWIIQTPWVIVVSDAIKQLDAPAR